MLEKVVGMVVAHWPSGPLGAPQVNKGGEGENRDHHGNPFPSKYIQTLIEMH